MALPVCAGHGGMAARAFVSCVLPRCCSCGERRAACMCGDATMLQGLQTTCSSTVSVEGAAAAWATPERAAGHGEDAIMPLLSCPLNFWRWCTSREIFSHNACLFSLAAGEIAASTGGEEDAPLKGLDSGRGDDSGLRGLGDRSSSRGDAPAASCWPPLRCRLCDLILPLLVTTSMPWASCSAGDKSPCTANLRRSYLSIIHRSNSCCGHSG
mmetsp:Transcript_21864/g.51048  ORF Transcript_21864/g.51048 Transcript_21864/m.51048 type:complete len:212 (+) Transcript_21864:939-1574(+)